VPLIPSPAGAGSRSPGFGRGRWRGVRCDAARFWPPCGDALLAAPKLGRPGRSGPQWRCATGAADGGLLSCWWHATRTPRRRWWCRRSTASVSR